ncbi:MAG: TetR/AcrR family transcriptional regulator [Bacteroidota bacterium]|jgi:TetR/AcrR family fatty acid metabolism transcriptional regulator
MRKREGNKEKAILEAAVKIFAQRGYHRAKISFLAEQAGIATGSVYLYFKNKETILLTIFDRLWIGLTDNLRNIVKQTDIDPSTKLDLVIDQFFDNFITNPSLASVFVNEQHHLIKDKRGNVAKHYNDFLDLAEDIIHEGVQKKVFNPDLDIKLFRHFITGGLRSVLLLWSQQSHSLPLQHVRQNVKFFIKHGLL